MTDMKEYRRLYYSNRYANDTEFRNYKKAYNRNLYVRKTISCTECGKRHNIQFLESINFEYDSKNNFICPECSNGSSPKIKSSCGCKKGGKKDHKWSQYHLNDAE